jgi:diguanylate cyclase (GGDEF)-like protein/PAS domain S-box-containing protein
MRATRSVAAMNPRAGGRMPLVAILDDRATNRHIFARLAASIEHGISVRTFDDPLVALDWLSENTPDIVITDFKMPNLDGAEFTRRFRALPGCGDVPVVVITVYDERSFRLSALEAGATDFLHSPVDHSEFVTRARNLLKLRKQQLMLQSRAHHLERELIESEQSREAVLRDSRERLAQIIDTVPAMVSATDIEGRCVFINACHSEAHGVESTEVAGKSTAAIFGKVRAERSRKLDQLVFETKKPLPSFEEEFIDHAGNRRVLLTTKSPLRDLSGAIVNVVTTSLDITDRKRAERHLLHLAHHDPLTDLPNRMLLTQKLRNEMEIARSSGGRFALHFLDLDHFKGINDVLGHSVGDRLLSTIGRELQGAVRESDIVARLGGDEFAVVQTEIEGADDAADLARRLIAVISRQIEIDGKATQGTGSIGITLFPNDGSDADELLKNADLAMYQAKADGGGSFRFFSADMHVAAQETSRLDADLRRAVEQEQFVLHYQPQVDAKTGRIVGAEALIRWRRDEEGIVLPAAFLDRAEQNGLIVPINDWVLREACLEAQKWRRAGLPPIRIAVNLSPMQFRRQRIAQAITQTLRETGLEPWRLELEITENIVMENSESLVRDFNRLRSLGVRFSIDDFGTGYSSFRYIKSFPIERLKIDQSFIGNMDRDPSDAAIVHAMIGLARNLNLDVIAEGVETEAQRTRLAAEGCTEMQGFLFSRPLPAEDFVELLRSENPVAQSA